MVPARSESQAHAHASGGLPPGITVHSPRCVPAERVRPDALGDAIRERARALGFVRVGFSTVGRLVVDASALERWRARGHAGSMGYLASPPERADPKALFPDARSMLVVAVPVEMLSPPPQPQSALGEALTSAVARYARAEDYHHFVKQRLRELADACADLVGREVRARACVDTAPLLERAAAARAGVGFVGKSTLLIVRGVGPQVVLGELLLDVELSADRPQKPGCGRCTACLEACPTAAFAGPYELDARRCISYLTIEHKGIIPRELRPAIGARVFGCDVCQEVCPYHRARRGRGAPTKRSGVDALVALLEIGSAEYRRLVRGTPMARASREKLISNAAIALGNSRDRAAAQPLARALSGSLSAIVRAHAAWALGRLGGSEARAALRATRGELDPIVSREVSLALDELESPEGEHRGPGARDAPLATVSDETTR